MSLTVATQFGPLVAYGVGRPVFRHLAQRRRPASGRLLPQECSDRFSAGQRCLCQWYSAAASAGLFNNVVEGGIRHPRSRMPSTTVCRRLRAGHASTTPSSINLAAAESKLKKPCPAAICIGAG